VEDKKMIMMMITMKKKKWGETVNVPKATRNNFD
jgi:hypothetical protein